MQPMVIEAAPSPAPSSLSAASHAYAKVHGLPTPPTPGTTMSTSVAIKTALALCVLIVLPLTLLIATLIRESSSEVFFSTMDAIGTLGEGDYGSGELDAEDIAFFERVAEELEANAEVLNDTSSGQSTLAAIMGDDDDVVGCGSRRDDMPGERNGAKIHFIHIPRTGGSSVEHAMTKWGKGAMLRYHRALVEGSNSACPPRTNDYALLAGQRGFGFCNEVSKDPKKFFSFTVIRDPLDRLISVFDSQIRANPDPFIAANFGAKSLNQLIKQYSKTTNVESGEAFLRYILSQQVRYLCGYECFMPSNATMNDPEIMLERALTNLQKLDAVGITSSMSALIYQLKVHLRWLPVGFQSFLKLNRGVSTPSKLDGHSQRVVLEWAKEETILYDMAKKLATQKTIQARECLNGKPSRIRL